VRKLLSRWFGRDRSVKARPAQTRLFHANGNDQRGPVELSRELELSADEIEDAPAVARLIREARPANAGPAEGALWDEIEASLQHEGLRLPPAPESALRAQALLDSPDVVLSKLAQLLETDPALATKLVGTANSPFYGGMSEVQSVNDAVVRLGVRQTRHLLLTVTLRGRVLRVRTPGFEDAPRQLWKHAMATAAAAQQVAAHTHLDPDAAFLAGLVQDLGQIAVLVAASEVHHRVGARHPLAQTAVLRAMQQLHEPLGGLICRSWHLPPQICAAVAAHHSPERAPAAAEPLARALRAADAISRHLEGNAELDEVCESAAMLGVQEAEVDELIEDTREAFEALAKQL
jgi:HD-like signal output (HDOD) protein